jgi:uncharacterized protein (TIGR00251 family)
MEIKQETTLFRLSVKVIANSHKARIIRDASKTLKVYIHSPREKGKANEELFTLFKLAFKPAKFSLKIVTGELQPKKILEFVFMSREDYHLFLDKISSY